MRLFLLRFLSLSPFPTGICRTRHPPTFQMKFLSQLLTARRDTVSPSSHISCSPVMQTSRKGSRAGRKSVCKMVWHQEPGEEEGERRSAGRGSNDGAEGGLICPNHCRVQVTTGGICFCFQGNSAKLVEPRRAPPPGCTTPVLHAEVPALYSLPRAV